MEERQSRRQTDLLVAMVDHLVRDDRHVFHGEGLHDREDDLHGRVGEDGMGIHDPMDPIHSFVLRRLRRWLKCCSLGLEHLVAQGWR